MNSKSEEELFSKRFQDYYSETFCILYYFAIIFILLFMPEERISLMNRKLSVFIIIILTMSVLSGCSQSRIAFSSSRDGNVEICTVMVNGEDYKNLTNNPSADLSPDWSPDGRKIVFYSDRDREKDNDKDYNTEIYIMNSNGSDQKRLTQNKYADIMPAFSPGGDRIAFSSDRKDKKIFDIFLINPDGTDEINVTSSIDANEKHPHWINNETLVFERIYFKDSVMYNHIYSMKIDGTDLRQITDTVYKDHSPVTSPDGSKIAFSREEGGTSNIYIVNIDGTEPERITEPYYTNEGPAWSPDSTHIAYNSLRNKSRQIFIMKLSDKSELPLLNPSPLDDVLPAWSPF